MNHWIIRFSLNTSFIFIIGSSITYNNVLGNSRLKSKLPRVEVSETVGNSTISISYSQPTVNWKKTWGKRVPFKKNWTMGDKEKTLITFEEDVKINNIRLGAGTYGFYVYPVNNNDWQIIFSKDINGTVDQYDKVDDMLRVSVVPQEAPLQKDLKIGVENIEESTKEICRGGDCDNKKIIPVFSADLYLKWETRKILLNLKMTGELRGNGFYPKNLTFPEKVAPVWKIVKSSLTALVEIDDAGFTEHTRYFSDDFLSNIVDGGGKAAYIHNIGHFYRAGGTEGITVNLENMDYAVEGNNATFNNIFVFFQHGALIYNFELKKKNGVWQVTKIRIPDQQGGEI